MSNHDAFLQKKKEVKPKLEASRVPLTSSNNSFLVYSTAEAASKVLCTVWDMSISEHCQEIGESPENSNPND